MKIQILTVGKMNDANLCARADDYLHRIHHSMAITLQPVKEEKIKSLSEDEIRAREGKRLLEKLHPRNHWGAMDSNGRMMTSPEFADFIHRAMCNGIPNLSFVIGGPLGLDRDVLSRSKFTMSLSKMTFPHELVVVLLLEQIYRGLSIIHGTCYHK